MASATVRFPSIKAVAAELRSVKAYLEGPTDVRLQVSEDGGWDVHTGDPCYDTDHNGYWGAGTLTRRSNSRELARDLIDQANDDHAQRA